MPYQSNKIDFPKGITWVPPPLVDPQTEKVIEAPSTSYSDIKKEMVNMLIIRRKKIKKHKLKKLRKRLHFYRAKVSVPTIIYILHKLKYDILYLLLLPLDGFSFHIQTFFIMLKS